MTQRPLQELRLRDFRCFREQQTARLAPLTLLVGENSTGKTSFLAAVRAILQVASTRGAPGFPDFRKPYDLGSFEEIAHRRGPNGARGGAESFGIGFRWAGVDVESVALDATFAVGDGAKPQASKLVWSAGDVWIEDIRSDDAAHTDMGRASRSWRLTLPQVPNRPLHYGRNALLSQPLDRILRDAVESGASETLRPLHRCDQEVPCEEDSRKLTELCTEILWCTWARTPGPPIQESPRRTYHPGQFEKDQGFSMPRSFARAHSRSPKRWQELKRSVEEFGRTSGTLDEIFIKRLGQGENDPFQLEVRKWSKKHNGAKYNLMDVGYGVSQVLSLLAQLSQDEDTLYLLQQPEVHLHPSAQAALATLFGTLAASGSQLIVETHSEYIVDRVRMDLRDRTTGLEPEDVSVLFFERTDLDVHIHSLRFDVQGNLLDAPDGYGQFFMDETRRSIGL